MSQPSGGFENTAPFSTGIDASLNAVQTQPFITDSLIQIQDRLQSALSSPVAAEWLETVFEITDVERTDDFIANVLADKLVLPQVQVLEQSQMRDALGKYSSENNTIYLSSNLAEADALTGMVDVLTTEVGHYIDTLLTGGQGTPGNEGALFQKTLWETSDLESLDAQVGGLATSATERSAQSNLNSADNTRATARNLGLLRNARTIRNSVDRGDRNDYYRFKLDKTSDFRLALGGLQANANIQLFDASGRSIGRSAVGGNRPENLRQTLRPGDYFVRVLLASNASTNYTMRLSARVIVPPDRAGNNRGRSRNVGVLSGTRTFRDFVGGVDTNDYYRFRVDQDSNFSLSMTGLAGDADVQLLDSQGELIDSSQAAGRQNESMTRLLTAGNYYVRVLPYLEADLFDTDYTLRLSATSALPPDNAGNTLGRARSLGVLSRSQTLRDFVGAADSEDYYRFRLQRDSSFRLALAGLSDDADVQLLDSRGQIIQSSTSAGNRAESITRQLTAGNYYVRVYPYLGETDYTLRLNATAALPLDQAGNNRGQARNLGTLSGSRNFQEFVGTTDTDDYYRFSLNQASRFRLSMAGLSQDADVQLLNSRGEVIEGAYREGNLSESIERTLNSGVYYVRVFPYSDSNTNYRLSLTANALGAGDRAGNRLDTARNIGMLGRSRSFEDVVNRTDTDDFYRFAIARASDFSLALTELSADADVALLNSDGQIIASSLEANTTSESINMRLAAGTYYVWVYPYATTAGTPNTAYRLTLGATQPSSRFSRVHGYGLVNAATAVAQALGRSAALPAVTDRGGNLWGADLVNAPEAWARGYTGDGVVVAVVDTGVDFVHPDLESNIWINRDETLGNGIDDDGNGFIDDLAGWDFFGRDNNPYDEEGHGTHVAGTIAARNNNVGVTGIAYDAEIMAVRVLGPSGGSNADVAAGIRYAANNGADVINLSLGGPSPSSVLESAIRYATQLGSFVVMASGNDNKSQPDFPARYALNHGVSVGAVDRNRLDASFSNDAGTNSNLRHVTAPGVDVYSTLPGDSYGNNSGTSMATPHVAGVVALMLEANPNLTPNQIRQILVSSSTRLA